MPDTVTLLDFPIARRIDTFDHMAYGFESLSYVLQQIEDTTGISIPGVEIVLTHRFPVHDLPMEWEPEGA